MSDTLLQLWETTVAQSLQTNLVSPVTSQTPAASDPLVKAAQAPGPQNQTSYLGDLGQNVAAYPTLTPSTPVTSDPLVAASFQPMGGQTSAQQQIASNPYSNSAPYSNARPTNTLNFSKGPAPANLTPPEGQVGSSQFHGGNLYRPGNDSDPLSTFAPIASAMPGSMLNSMDVFAIAQWARAVSMNLGILGRPDGDTSGQRSKAIAKGVSFLATQALLTTFNPADPQNGGLLNLVYNPASLPASLVPGLRGNALSSPNMPAFLSGDGKVYSSTVANMPDALDRHLLMRQGAYTKTLNASDLANGRLSNYPGFIGDLSKPGPQDTLGPYPNGVSIAAQVDQTGFLAAAAKGGQYMLNMYTADNPYNMKPAIDLDYIEDQMKAQPNKTPQQIILETLFKPSAQLPAPNLKSIASTAASALTNTKSNQYRWYSGPNLNKVSSNPASYPSSVDAAFPNEDPDGTILESAAINDDSNYMPFSFQDLRDDPPSLLYFRAFLKDGVAESFQPNWQSEGFYGRTDQVPTYINTMRTIQLGFNVVAWHPNDLPVIWTKLNKLQSMVYPTYDTNRYLQAGPLVRMRVGDLFSVRSDGSKSAKGLPGYISSLNYSYDDNIWNVRSNFKIPRKVSVTLGFVVVHDGNPGVYVDTDGTGIFGTLEFRSPAPAQPASLPGVGVPASTDTGTPVPGGIRGIINTIASSSIASPVNPIQAALTSLPHP